MLTLAACTTPGRVTTVRPDGTDSTEIDVGGNDQDHLGGWSPDGKNLVLTSEGRVFTVARDGSGQQRLTRGEDPAWAPDGRRITFVPGSGIHIIGVDGSGEQLLVNHAHAPEWSPASDRIAFEGQGPKVGIHVIASDGLGERVLVGGGRASWSPNGRQLVFTRGGDVHAINADGSGERRVASQAEVAKWSPDGRNIAVAGTAIRVLNSDGTRDRVVVDAIEPEFGHALDWSPDGRSLVFESRGEILVTNVDGSGGRGLAVGGRPVWSPDGEYIAYEGEPSGTPCHHGEKPPGSATIHYGEATGPFVSSVGV